MLDHEFEIIAAYAAGDTSPEESERARALIASGAEYREEYEAQLAALEALAGTGPVMMTDLERARLHRDVLAAVTARPTRRTEPRSLRWLRPLAVAAAAVVIVGFGGLFLSTLGSGDTQGDAASQPVLETLSVSDGDATTTTRAAAQGNLSSVRQAEGTVESGTDEDTLAYDSAAAALPEPLDLGNVSSRDIDEDYLTDIYLGAAQFTRDEAVEAAVIPLMCSADAGELADEGLLAYGTAEYDGQPAEYFGFVSRRLIFFDAGDCSVLGEHP